MEATPRGNRLHIAIFGRRNAGKSSLINALTGQEIALVSPVAGTTTDPVYKAMELLPLGPVMLIDTAGLDDVGELGELRSERSWRVLDKTDLALLVLSPEGEDRHFERELVAEFRRRGVKALGVLNKIDLIPTEERQEALRQAAEGELGLPFFSVSAQTRAGIEDLKQALIQYAPEDWDQPTIVGDLIQPGDLVVLVVPIDLAAPKGRLILPQVQTLRDLLDHDAIGVVTKEHELKETLASLSRKPRLVITDSQAFLKVSADTPPEVMLTSFSILFARYKGDLCTFVEGVEALARLRPGDKVLIAEACTHHRQPDDIGKVKIPRWLRQLVGGPLEFVWVAGNDFPRDLSPYQLVVHCGACMVNRREVLSRIAQARAAQVPIVNYGVLIAAVHGILPRALAPFGITLAKDPGVSTGASAAAAMLP